MSGGVVAERLGRQYLYAYVAVEVFIAGAIDFAHAAGADPLGDGSGPDGGQQVDPARTNGRLAIGKKLLPLTILGFDPSEPNCPIGAERELYRSCR